LINLFVNNPHEETKKLKILSELYYRDPTL